MMSQSLRRTILKRLSTEGSAKQNHGQLPVSMAWAGQSLGDNEDADVFTGRHKTLDARSSALHGEYSISSKGHKRKQSVRARNGNMQ
jgi:hypothetical protein